MSFGYDIKTAALRQFMPKVEQYPQIALALSIVLDPDRLHNDRIDAAKTAFELICRLVQPVEPQASTTVFSNLETTFEALAGIAAKIDTLPPPRPIVFEKLQDSDTLRTYLKRFGIHGSMTADEKSDFRARVEVNVETVLQYGLGGYGKEHKPSDLMILTKVCDYILSRQTPEQQSYGPRPDLLALAFLALPKTLAPLREVIIETTALAYMPSEFYDLAPTNLLHLTQEELLNAFNKRSAEEWIITTDDGMQQIQDKITADTLKAHAQGKRNLTRAAPKTRSTVATMLSPLGLALLELAPLLPLLEIKVDKTDFHNRPYFQNSPTCIFIHNKDISRLQETTVDRKAADIHEFPIKDLLDPGQPLDELLDEVEGRLQALITFGQSPHDIVSLLSEDLTLETALKRVSRMRVALKNETGKVTAYLDPEVRKAMPLNTLDKAAKAARHIIMFAWDLRASEVTTLYESLPSESGQKTNKYTVHFVDDWPDGTTPLEARFEGFNFYLPTRLLKALHQQKNIQAQDLLRLHITYLLAKEAVTENDIEKLIEQLFPSMSADKRQSLAERYRALRLELKSQPASVRYSLKSKDNQEALDKRRRQSDSQKGKKHEDKDSGESQKQTKAETVEDFVCPPKQELPTRLQDSLSQKLLSAFAAREAGEISEESIRELCRAIPIEWITSKKIPEASTQDLFMNERNRQRFQFLGVPVFTDTSRPKAQKILQNYINFLRNSYRTFQKDKPASVNIQQMIDLTLARSLRQDEPVDLILCARQVLGETAPIIALEDLARHYERCHAEQSKTYRDKFGGFSEYLGIWNDENPECLQKDVVSELIKESLLTQSYTPQNSEHIETTPPLSALAESIFYEGSESEATQRWAEVLKIIEQHPKEKKAELPERKFKSLEWILPEATSLVKKLETLYQKGSSKKYIFIAESAAGGAVGEMEIIQIDRLDELVMIDGQTIAPNQIHFMHEDITTADTENQKRLFKTSADDLAVLFSYYFRSLPNTSSLDILKSALRGNLTPLELRNHLNNLLQNTASDPTRFLIGNLAMTQFWPDPVRSHKESVTIEKDMMAYLWLRRTGADFCIEGTEEEIRVKRNSLRAALFNATAHPVETNILELQKESLKLYDDIVVFWAKQWSGKNEALKVRLIQCPEIFAFTTHCIGPLAMLIEANWEKLSSTINDYSNIVTEPGVSQALEKNLLLYVMSQRSDMRDASGKHLYAKVLDGYKTISNDLNLAPSKSILSLMFMGGFFYDANHLRNVSQILDSQLSKVPINSVALLDTLSRYYFRYRDEIRNRLNTNAYTKKVLSDGMIPPAANPFEEFTDNPNSPKDFHTYDELRMLSFLSPFSPGELGIEDHVAHSFIRRILVTREAIAAWPAINDIIDYIRLTGDKSPIRDLALANKKSDKPESMCQSVDAIYKKHQDKIIPTLLKYNLKEGLDKRNPHEEKSEEIPSGYYFGFVHLEDTYAGPEEYDLTQPCQHWAEIKQSLDKNDANGIRLRIVGKNIITLEPVMPEEWKGAIGMTRLNDMDPDHRVLISAHLDTKYPQTLIISRGHPLIRVFDDYINLQPHHTQLQRDPVLDIAVCWSLWATLRPEYGANIFKCVTDMCDQYLDHKERDPINRTPMNDDILPYIKNLTSIMKGITTRFRVTGAHFFARRLVKTEPNSVEVYSDDNDLIPLGLDHIQDVSLESAEYGNVREYFNHFYSHPEKVLPDEIYEKLSTTLRIAGETFASRKRDLNQRWFEEIGTDISIKDMPELSLLDRDLHYFIETFQSPVVTTQKIRDEIDQIWKRYFSDHFKQPLFKVSAIIIMLLGVSGLFNDKEVLKEIERFMVFDDRDMHRFTERKNEAMRIFYNAMLGLYLKYRHEILWRICENPELQRGLHIQSPSKPRFSWTSRVEGMQEMNFQDYDSARMLWKTCPRRNDPVFSIYILGLTTQSEADPDFKALFAFIIAHHQSPAIIKKISESSQLLKNLISGVISKKIFFENWISFMKQNPGLLNSWKATLR